MKLAALLSGGKDSVNAIHIAKSRAWDIEKTIIMKPENPESWMYHYPELNIPETQSKLMNIPYKSIKTKGKKEKELKPLKKTLKKLKQKEKIEGFISGAIESEYQKERLDKIGQDLDLKTFHPLWRKDPEKILKKQIEQGFELIITQIAAGGLDKSWLGRKIDREALKELKQKQKEHGVHITGEGGEYETTVLNAPLFTGKIVIKEAEKQMETPNRGKYRIKKIETQPK